MPGPLHGVRVLDLATPRAELAGRLLADLGADVLKVEPPGGAAARRLPPFEAGREEDPNGSLYWAALALGKRSVELDLSNDDGRRSLRALAARADVLVESYDPGTMAQWGFGYRELSVLNPRLVYVSVTPFGQEGPKARWPATDLTIEAAGGRVALQGDHDRPPVPVGYPQASFHAAAQAAADAVIALNEREISGLGQHLDTSMQDAIVWTLTGASGYPPFTGSDPPGAGDQRGDAGGGGFRTIYECADGYVAVNMVPAGDGAALVPLAMRELAERDELDERLRDFDWNDWPASFLEGRSSPEQAARILEGVATYFRKKTKRELVEWTAANDLRLGPVYTTRDLLADPQLQARDYWRRVGGRLHPGPSPQLSRTPLELRSPAPSLGDGEDTASRWLHEPPAPTAPVSFDGERSGEAFAGLKVVDFGWVVVGPTIGKALADHGATVVRIESSARMDLARRLPPFMDGEAGVNRSYWMANFNTSKLSVAMDLSTYAGRTLARRAVDWADVVIESYTPGTMKRLGLDFETVSERRDDLIMLSTCLLGQTGPLATYAGYGQQGAAFAGIHALTGWPDRIPCGAFGPYTDVIAPKSGIAALAAAILHRRRTGLGQHIDLSQVEAAIHFIEPLVLDETVNGRTAGAAGTGSASACPHGVYPTRETERYVAIAVETPDQWRALRGVAPLDDFADARLDGLGARMTVSDGIDAALREWSSQAACRDLERELVGAGVPAAVVQRPSDLYEDPQLKHRGFFVTLDHTELGAVTCGGLATHFSAKRTMLHGAAPCLGEHTAFVLRELLGLSEDEAAEHAAAGVLS